MTKPNETFTLSVRDLEIIVYQHCVMRLMGSKMTSQPHLFLIQLRVGEHRLLVIKITMQD